MQPNPFKAWQQPFPTSPYPQMTTCFPPNITSVDLLRLFKKDFQIYFIYNFLKIVYLSIINFAVPIDNTLSATVEIVEFGFRHTVVYIHGRDG